MNQGGADDLSRGVADSWVCLFAWRY